MTSIEATKKTIGNLPSGWRWVRLGEIGSFEAGGTPSKAVDDYWGGDIPFVTGADITELLVTRDSARAFLTEAGVGSGKTVICRPNTILLVTRTGVGRAGIATELMCASQDITAFLCGSELEPEYVCRYLISIAAFLVGNSRGATIQGLTREFVINLDIPLPPLDEQRRIAGVLREQMASVGKACAAAKTRLETIRQLPLAYYREEFGESPAFAASPVTPTKPIRTGWRWHRLTDLARLATGHTPSRYQPEFWKGDIPWLQLADIRALDGREAFDTSEHTNELGIRNSAAVILPKGTVCMSRTASVGFFAIMGRPMATSQDFVNWVCGPELDPWFLMHLLISCRNLIRDLGSGAVHNTIYFPTVEAFSVCVPSLSEQRGIAELLSGRMLAVAKARAAAEEERRTISTLPAALLRRAFNGEI